MWALVVEKQDAAAGRCRVTLENLSSTLLYTPRIRFVTETINEGIDETEREREREKGDEWLFNPAVVGSFNALI